MQHYCALKQSVQTVNAVQLSLS